MVSFRPWFLHPSKRAPGMDWIGGWVGPRAYVDTMVKRKILPLPEIEAWLYSP